MNNIPTKRKQWRMTRDPYIAYYTLAVKWELIYFVESMKMPWYCYNPIVWRWRRRLIKDKQSLWKKRLDYYRAMATMISLSGDPNVKQNKEEA